MQVESLRRPLRQLKTWLLFGGSFRLQPHEERCIQAWRGRLGPDAVRLLDAQLAALDRYKRSSDGRVVSFFSTAIPNGHHLPGGIRFPLREEETRAAVVELALANGSSVKVRVVLTEGELLSLQFGRPPAEFRKTTVQSVSVEMLRDVMQAGTTPQLTDGKAALESLLGESARRARDVRAPVSEDERDALLRGLDATLPEQYLRLIAVADGFVIGPVRLYGLKDVWSAPRPDGVFYVIAAIDGDADLAVKGGERSGRVYRLGYETELASPLNAPLIEELNRHLSG